jgi:GNAT superfamily N-acetyltransferase
VPDQFFRLRQAVAADIPALARLHVDTFNETHRGGASGGPSYALREQQWREEFDRADERRFCFVVEDERGELVGFAKGVPHEGGVPHYAGELNKIYVLERVQRRGLGRQLLFSVARRFKEYGVNSMLLFGDPQSSSNGFYEAHGAQRIYSEGGEFHGGYGWPDLGTLLGKSN